ncbi:MAG: MBL fold metallo-hydrolase, partial [Gemmatimonadetes bacterium]|nr:MBL fold metallo-hydrolase [Gemmatimonadota bacterium]
LCLGLAAGAPSLSAQAAAPRLRFEQVLADSTAFDVVATLIIGPRHVLLWDAQYHKADAVRVAEAIARSGRTLQAIVLSHPDEDHLSGVATLLERFPGTPVYLSHAGLQWFDSTAQARFQADRARNPELFPDSLPRPREWPHTRMELDGVRLELLPDLQGDVRMPTNTALWIPELRTVLAGDIVFRGVHPWLGARTPRRAGGVAGIVAAAPGPQARRGDSGAQVVGRPPRYPGRAGGDGPLPGRLRLDPRPCRHPARDAGGHAGALPRPQGERAAALQRGDGLPRPRPGPGAAAPSTAGSGN